MQLAEVLVPSSMDLLLQDQAVVDHVRLQPSEARSTTLFEALAINFLYDWGITMEQVPLHPRGS
jgi:hypothetical protein